MRWLIVTTKSDLSISYFSRDMAIVGVVIYGEPLPLASEYDVIYFRDPFNSGAYDKKMIRDTVEKVVARYPEAYFVDGIKRYDDLLIEDKWRQYEKLKTFMPPTRLLRDKSELRGEKIAKKRISARARDIAFSPIDIHGRTDEFILQDKLSIIHEYRVYSIGRKLLPVVAVKSSKTLESKAKVQGCITLGDSLKTFTQKILDELSGYDFLGFDIAKTKDDLVLIEVNRSPQFKRYNEMAERNIAADVMEAIQAKVI